MQVHIIITLFKDYYVFYSQFLRSSNTYKSSKRKFWKNALKFTKMDNKNLRTDDSVGNKT